MGSSPSINIPPQQGYGEALSESLRAQVDLLSGRGDFEDTGGLQNLLETTDLGTAPSPMCGLEDSQLELCFSCGIEG